MSSLEFLVPSTIWTKFDIDSVKLSTEAVEESVTQMDKQFQVNHDCMWAGHCSNLLHDSDDPRFNNSNSSYYCKSPAAFGGCGGGVAAAAAAFNTHMLHQQQQQHQMSLLKTAVNPITLLPMQAPISTIDTIMPQTPPMSDDEESRVHSNHLLNLFRDRSESEIDDDDLSKYLDECDDYDDDIVIKEELIIKDEVEDYVNDDEEEQEDEEEEEDSEEEDDEEEQGDDQMAMVDDKQAVQDTMRARMRAYQFAAESDHSYHKSNQSSALNLGLETPSDSGMYIILLQYFFY